jgi:hypothetical protein
LKIVDWRLKKQGGIMPKYIVQGTHIKHGKKGAKKAEIYGPGDEIELTEKEAELLGKSVKPAPENPENAKGKK